MVKERPREMPPADGITVVEEVVKEAPACVLTAQSAKLGRITQEISWTELANEDVGSEWMADGGGETFGDWMKATLVYRNDDFAVLLIERHYAEKATPAKDIDEYRLQGYRCF